MQFHSIHTAAMQFHSIHTVCVGIGVICVSNNNLEFSIAEQLHTQQLQQIGQQLDCRVIPIAIEHTLVDTD